jgi:tetratricopeptide (TPR) repeat protein
MSDPPRDSMDVLCMACLSGDRKAAADVLRAARRASPEGASELLDSLLLVHSPSRPMQRLKIRLSLDAGHVDEADAWTARALLLWPVDPSLMLLRGHVLAARGRWQEADAEVTAVMGMRPHHCGAIRLAARIASALGEHQRAVALLDRVAERQPAGENVPEHLAETLLDAGDLPRAAAVAESIVPRNALLLARIRRAQGRMLDAVELIEGRLAMCDTRSETDRCLGLLIAILEEAGDVHRVRETVLRIEPQHSSASLCAALALLGLGEFAAAARRLATLIRTDSCSRPALHALAVAATLMGRVRLAQRALRRLWRTREGVDRPTMLECWRRGLLGRLMREQHSPSAGRDPGSGILPALLESAVKVFERARAGRSAPALDRHCAMCLAALNRH